MIQYSGVDIVMWYVTYVIKFLSDSNNLFIWHESVDINRKSLFPKSQLPPILHFQVRHDCVHSIVPIEHCVWLILINETLCKKFALIS